VRLGWPVRPFFAVQIKPRLNLGAAPRDKWPCGVPEVGTPGQFHRGELIMIGNIARASVLALVTASTTGVAVASTPYDGRWSLSIVTQRGACDTYNFPVNITNGAVTFPGLVKASGRVTPKGGVRVFVAAGGKSASGSGKLSLGSGSGRWTGRSGDARCSGSWTAQRA
jgi:hypothetical protein